MMQQIPQDGSKGKHILGGNNVGDKSKGEEALERRVEKCLEAFVVHFSQKLTSICNISFKKEEKDALSPQHYSLDLKQ